MYTKANRIFSMYPLRSIHMRLKPILVFLSLCAPLQTRCLLHWMHKDEIALVISLKNISQMNGKWMANRMAFVCSYAFSALDIISPPTKCKTLSSICTSYQNNPWTLIVTQLQMGIHYETSVESDSNTKTHLDLSCTEVIQSKLL